MVRSEGPQLIRPPNYHVFDLLKGHMDAESAGVESDESADLDAVASVSVEGRQTTVSIVNQREDQRREVGIRLVGLECRLPGRVTATALKGARNDENTPDEPEKVVQRSVPVEGQGGEWSVVCEPYSPTVLTIRRRGISVPRVPPALMRDDRQGTAFLSARHTALRH